jgi:hypothetical protein
MYVQGPILEHYQERGTTVNSVHYSEMLWDHFISDIQTKHKGLLSKDGKIMHNNAHPHTASSTVESFCQLNFVVMEHPLYSHDLTPSITCLVNSKMLQDGKISSLTKKWCMHGLSLSKKHFF